jgi:hypothetical protein
MAAIPPEIANRVSVMRQFAQKAWDAGEFFFYVRIPEPLFPEERGLRYEEPLIDALTKARLGRVTGGGQQLGEGKTIIYCGVDVVVKERVRGLKLIRRVLRKANAPAGTVIEEHLPSYCEHPLIQARPGPEASAS